MTVDGIEKAMAQAKRFINDCEVVMNTIDSISSDCTIWGTKESGQLRRTSMDLTRALTEMRKP